MKPGEDMPKADAKPPLKVGVVIGGGGIRALAALPMLDFLHLKKVPIDAIISTAGGAVLAALYAAGYSAEEIPQLMGEIFDRKLYDKFDYGMLLKIFGFTRQPFTSPPAPYKDTPLKKCLRGVFKEKRLETMPQRLFIQATDMGTGDAIALDKGLLSDCLYASNATYPFFPPIQLEERWLTSGLFTAALPLLTAVQQNLDLVFVIGFSDDISLSADNTIEYINNFFYRSCSSIQIRQTTLAISLHQGEAVLLNIGFEKSISLWDTHRIPEILAAGKKALAKHMDQIEEAINSLSIPT